MKRSTLAAFSLSVLLPSSSQTLLIPAIPTLVEERGFSAATTGWLLSAFLIGASLSAPLVGRVGDLRGRRRLSVITSSAYVIGALLCLASGDHGLPMAIGRALQGFSAGVFALHIASIQELAPSAAARAGYIGILSGVVATGPALGFVIGGALAAHYGVAAIFLVGAAVGSFSTLLLWFLTPVSGGEAEGDVDGHGAALVGLSLLCFLAWLTEIGVSGLSERRTLVTLACCVLVSALTIWWLRKVDEPFINLPILVERTGALGNAATVLSSVAMFGLFVAVPQLAQDELGRGLGLGPVAAGMLLVPGALAMVLVGPLAGRLGATRGHGEMILVGNLICAIGMLALGALPHSVVSVAVLATVAGLGVGVSFPALPSVVMAAAPDDAVGVAAGINSLSRGVGSAVGAQVVLLVSAVGAAGGGGHRAAFVVGAVGAAAAALVALRIIHERCETGGRPSS